MEAGEAKRGKEQIRAKEGLNIEQLKVSSIFSDRKCKFQRYKYLTLESWLLACEGVPSKGKGCSKVQLSISLPWQERNARRSCLQRRSIQEKYLYEKPHLDNLSSPVNRCSGDKTVCCTLFVRHRWLQLYQKGCRGAYLGLVITTFFHLSIHNLIYLSKILNQNKEIWSTMKLVWWHCFCRWCREIYKISRFSMVGHLKDIL